MPTDGDRASAQPRPLAHLTGHASRLTLNRKTNAGRIFKEYREAARRTTEFPVVARDGAAKYFRRGARAVLNELVCPQVTFALFDGDRLTIRGYALPSVGHGFRPSAFPRFSRETGLVRGDADVC
jgi:hypothetical protein